jgi:hypothetical protein
VTSPHTATLKEFAAIIRRSPSYVTKLKQSGKLVMAGRKVDVAASQALISGAGGARPDMEEHWRRERGEGPAPDPNGDDNTLPAFGTRAYWERMDREEVARIRRIERQKLEGTLVEREAVDFVLKDFGATLRSLLENLADRLAPQLYPLTTLEDTHVALTEAFEDLQRELHEAARRRAETLGQ